MFMNLMKTLLMSVVTTMSLAAAAAEYSEVPYQDKLKDKDLTFCVTFDKRSVNADFAKGNPYSTTLKNLDLSLRGIIGFDGAQAFKPEGAEQLKFDVSKNVSLRQGTVVMWLSGSNFAPGDAETDGKKRGNVTLLHMVFKNSKQWVDFKLYEYAGIVYFDWRNSVPPHGWGSIGRVQAALSGIKKGQWFQLAMTWTPEDVAIFLNGKLMSKQQLPVKVSKTLNLVPDPKLSFIGIKSWFYEDKNKWEVALDDVKIYSRALSPLEIENKYLRLVKSGRKIILQNFGIALNGVDDGNGKLDRLEAEFDFTLLSGQQQKQLQAGEVKLNYQLSGPEGLIKSGSWEITRLETSKIIYGVTKPGKYTLKAILIFPNSEPETATAQVERPDLSFAGNKIGCEDTVPEPWTPLIVEGDRTVKIWNRIYKFGVGPFPTEILVKGKSLLKNPPKLNISTPKGKANIKYKFTGMERGNSWVEFKGVGNANTFSLSYTTRIEFDGLIKTDFVMNGSPVIDSMKLKWTVNPAYADYLMTPLLQQNQTGEFAFQYPNTSWGTQLWLVSEKGGFCWSIVNDANWIYKLDQKIFKVNQKTGQCEVDMITSKIKLPPATPYQALFIATPTRPLPARNRLIRLQDLSRADMPKLLGWQGKGLEGIGTFKPHEKAFSEFMKNKVPNSVGVYGMADALTTTTPATGFLKKYWNIPGAYVYKMTYKQPTADGKTKDVKCFSVSACPKTTFSDYIINNIQAMFNHEFGNRVWMIYYDLCGVRLCFNKLHGCSFKDKFGRQVNTFNLLHKRRHVLRTVRLCHKNNRVVMTHAQRYFYPMLNGLGDYFFPGEQHHSMLQRNPYGYTDEVPDILYRTEYNRNILGVGVIFLPDLQRANASYYEVPEYTESMFCMLLPHDIETAETWANGGVVHKVWNIFEKYGMDSPEVKVHRYFEQHKIKNSNPAIRITWYECPNQRYLIILANKDISAQSGSIDINAIKSGDYQIRAEYTDKDINVKSGKFNITVPARGFRIIAFPPKGFYPYEDEMSKQWSSWKDSKAVASFKLDRKTGFQKPGSLLLEIDKNTPPNSSFCFLKRFPAKPGRTYNAIVWAKAEGVDKGCAVSLAFQGQDIEVHFLGTPVQSSKLSGWNISDDWRRLVLTFTVPKEGKWAETCYLLVTMGAEKSRGGKVWFDDFTLKEN